MAQLSVVTTPTNVKCNGGSNGAATATASGGVQPYSFFWNNGVSGASIINVTAGLYTVTVTGGNGATASAQVQINQPPVLGVSAFGQSQICSIVPDGIASAVPFGGTPPYTYLWSNGQTSAQITGLAQGTYTVTTTDQNGCTASASTTIVFWNEGLWITVSVAGQPNCAGTATGSVQAMVMSGTPPYTYHWSTGVTQTTPLTMFTLNNLPAGSYTVTVTDVNGCTHDGTAVLTDPPAINVFTSSTPAICGNGGSATVSPSGGTPPFNVLWNTGSNNFTITGLAPGSYTATVTDSKFCQKVAGVQVTGQAGNLQLSANVLSNASCTTGGSASVNAFNGSGNYTYHWDNGQNTQTATNLTVGSHSVTVIDATNGCQATASVFISQISAPTLSASITQQATCLTGASAIANVSGGTQPYSYHWDNNQNTQAAQNLGIGTHGVTVTDAGGCVVIASVQVFAPQGPSVTTQVLSNATCTSGGSAKANPTGGAGNYVYLWDNGQTGMTATNLSAGNHVVTVTDAAGCAAVGLVNIPQSAGPNVVAVSIAPATCLTGGTATANVTGGTPPYTYHWDNGQNTQTATNLSPGVHKVTVTDAGGCTAVGMVTISAPLQPSVLATPTAPATCTTGGSATALGSGGTPPYSYHWDNGQNSQNATNLAPGIHTVTLTDANGCTATATVSISGPTAPSAMITASSNANCGGNGSATVTANGGILPYSYHWDNNENTATATNLAAGPHTVTVTDAGGCTATASVTIGLTNNGIKIGDFVWYDTDQDGFQHPSETSGVPNMTVMLIKPGPDGQFGTADDIIVKTTTTNGNGLYEFNCVTPGQYIIMFSGLPVGMQFTKKDAVSNDCKDSDVNSAGKTSPFTIVAGQPDNLCFDAGVHQFCDNVTMAGQICCDQTICEGTIPAPIYSVMPAGGGSGGAIQYVWLQLIVGPNGSNWIGIPGATGLGLTLGPLYTTGHFMRCARREGCVNFLETNIVTITVIPAGTPPCGPFSPPLTVKLKDKYSVLVQFQTNPEPVQYEYTIQHSPNGTDWKDLTTIMGKQDATATNSYEYLHQQPSAGMNFYRIGRTDISNNHVFSPPASLEMQIAASEALLIAPNPVSDKLLIKNFLSYESDVNIQLSASNGVVLHQFDIPAGTILSEELPMKHLPAGVYIARIRFSAKEVRTVKLIKY